MQFTCHEKVAEILFENFKAVARKFRASSTYLIVHALVHYYSKETTNLPQPLATEYIDRRYKHTLYMYMYTAPHCRDCFYRYREIVWIKNS